MRVCASAWMLGAAMLSAACSSFPAQREAGRAREVIGTVDSVATLALDCGSSILASDEWCADLTMKDGKRLRFERVGFNAFGSSAVNVFVSEAGGLTPRIASCDGVATPNLHRESALGHRFRPTLIDVKDAVFRYKEVLQEVQFWPQCPQYWETTDRLGARFRFCARKAGATDEPPRPDCVS
ncbi:MAG: hypothetical protein RLZZ53_1447 [Acidobacteriota bacterium]